jgi:hypothetical protein
MMDECASGFAGHPGRYFIDRRGALGVMTGQYTLLEYQTTGFSPRCEGFCLNSVYGLPNQDLLWILRQEAVVLARSAQDSSRMHSKETRFTDAKCKGSHHKTSAEFKSSSFIANIYTSLIQSSRRACSTQIGGE